MTLSFFARPRGGGSRKASATVIVPALGGATRSKLMLGQVHAERPGRGYNFCNMISHLTGNELLAPAAVRLPCGETPASQMTEEPCKAGLKLAPVPRTKMPTA
jgi:hypothetical protein